MRRHFGGMHYGNIFANFLTAVLAVSALIGVFLFAKDYSKPPVWKQVGVAEVTVPKYRPPQERQTTACRDECQPQSADNGFLGQTSDQ